MMLAAQEFKCAICLVEGKPFHVDHNHKNGKIRALLCSNCNTALGLLHDAPETLRAAALYLEKHA